MQENITDEARAIKGQIENNLPKHLLSGDAFVVSLYGEWGIGKTKVLRDVEMLFGEELEEAEKKEKARGTIPLLVDRWQGKKGKKEKETIPIFFNPWRYEHEAHMIVPLFQTIATALENKNKEGKLDRAISIFKSTAFAFISSIKSGVDIPLIGSLSFDGDKFKDTIEQLNKKEEEDIYSLYFDMNNRLEKLTEENNINLVILIDDLDRCLPEKAIAVLESVKVFLNIKNFAFVLAVDDEVVERGINHRYRDYIFSNNKTDSPITGVEYLEKIVHLPVHLSRWSEDKVREFLLEKDKENLLFFIEIKKDNKQEEEKNTEDIINEELLDLFTKALPPIPRKLIRAYEGLLFLKKRIYEKLGKELKEDELLHALRFIILQQLYPQIYRIVRDYNIFYPYLFVTYIKENEIKIYLGKEAEESNSEEKLSDVFEEYKKKFEKTIKECSLTRGSKSPLDAFSGKYENGQHSKNYEIAEALAPKSENLENLTYLFLYIDKPRKEQIQDDKRGSFNLNEESIKIWFNYIKKQSIDINLFEGIDNHNIINKIPNNQTLQIMINILNEDEDLKTNKFIWRHLSNKVSIEQLETMYKKTNLLKDIKKQIKER